MPTKKRSRKVSGAERAVAAEERKADKALGKFGLNARTVAAALITIIGAALILTNLAGIVLAFVGFVLVYFGLKMFGIDIKL